MRRPDRYRSHPVLLGANDNPLPSNRHLGETGAVHVFVSAVSHQFEACREALARDLRDRGANVTLQSEFSQHPRSLLEKLQAYIDACDCVVALIGDAYGAEPPPDLIPHAPQRSYTQWEYCLALGERLDGSTAEPKTVYVYLADPVFLSVNAVSQPALLGANQANFRNRILRSGKDYSTFQSLDQLRRKVQRDLVFSVPGENRAPPERRSASSALSSYLEAVARYCEIDGPLAAPLWVTRKLKPLPLLEPKASTSGHAPDDDLRRRPYTSVASLSMDEALRFPLVSIEAGPGIGKSTLLKQAVRASLDAAGQATPLIPVLVPARLLVEHDGSLAAALHAAVTRTLHLDLRTPLPLDFFDSHPPGATARWLLLIDALDEILDSGERRQIVHQLTGLRNSGFHVVITARAFSDEVKTRFAAVDGRLFELPPFDDVQLAEFADASFGKDTPSARTFVMELGTERLAFLGRVPLFVAMAAAIYTQRPHEALPTSRASLYQRFVTLSLAGSAATAALADFRQRWVATGGGNSSNEPGSLFSQRRYILQHTAVAHRRDPRLPLAAQASSAAVVTAVSATMDTGWRQERMAELLATTGLVHRHEGQQEFLHQSLIDYLTAEADGGQWPTMQEIEQNAESPRSDVLLFRVGARALVEDAEPYLVSVLTNANRDSEAVLFCALAIADGITVSERLRIDVGERLIDWLGLLWNISDETWRAVSRYPAGESLRDRIATFGSRDERAAECLARMSAVTQLIRLARDPHAYAQARMIACREWIRHAPEDAIPTALDLMMNVNFGSRVRTEAVEVLAPVLDPSLQRGLAIRISRADDDDSSATETAPMLARLGAADYARDILLARVRDVDRRDYNRRHVPLARLAAALHEREYSAPALALLTDRNYDVWTRSELAKGLVQAGLADSVCRELDTVDLDTIAGVIPADELTRMQDGQWVESAAHERRYSDRLLSSIVFHSFWHECETVLPRIADDALAAPAVRAHAAAKLPRGPRDRAILQALRSDGSLDPLLRALSFEPMVMGRLEEFWHLVRLFASEGTSALRRQTWSQSARGAWRKAVGVSRSIIYAPLRGYRMVRSFLRLVHVHNQARGEDYVRVAAAWLAVLGDPEVLAALLAKRVRQRAEARNDAGALPLTILLALGRTDFLLQLIREDSISPRLFGIAVASLKSTDPFERGRWWEFVCRAEGLEEHWRMNGIRELEKDKAANRLSSIAADRVAIAWVRVAALRALGRLGAIDVIDAVVRGGEADDWIAFESLETLAAAGADTALASVATDHTLSSAARMRAAICMSGRGSSARLEEIASLMADTSALHQVALDLTRAEQFAAAGERAVTIERTFIRTRIPSDWELVPDEETKRFVSANGLSGVRCLVLAVGPSLDGYSPNFLVIVSERADGSFPDRLIGAEVSSHPKLTAVAQSSVHYGNHRGHLFESELVLEETVAAQLVFAVEKPWPCFLVFTDVARRFPRSRLIAEAIFLRTEFVDDWSASRQLT